MNPEYHVRLLNDEEKMIKAHCLVERLDHGLLVRGVDVAGTHALAEAEDGLDD